MPMRLQTLLSTVSLIYRSVLLATTSAYRPTETSVTGMGMNMSASGPTILVANYYLKNTKPNILGQQ